MSMKLWHKYRIYQEAWDSMGEMCDSLFIQEHGCRYPLYKTKKADKARKQMHRSQRISKAEYIRRIKDDMKDYDVVMKLA